MELGYCFLAGLHGTYPTRFSFWCLELHFCGGPCLPWRLCLEPTCLTYLSHCSSSGQAATVAAMQDLPWSQGAQGMLLFFILHL